MDVLEAWDAQHRRWSDRRRRRLGHRRSSIPTSRARSSAGYDFVDDDDDPTDARQPRHARGRNDRGGQGQRDGRRRHGAGRWCLRAASARWEGTGRRATPSRRSTGPAIAASAWSTRASAAGLSQAEYDAIAGTQIRSSWSQPGTRAGQRRLTPPSTRAPTTSRTCSALVPRVRTTSPPTSPTTATTSVDLFAPGVDIVSTEAGWYYVSDGTSMATPHVAAVPPRARWRRIRRNLTPARAQACLIAVADDTTQAAFAEARRRCPGDADSTARTCGGARPPGPAGRPRVSDDDGDGWRTRTTPCPT